MKEQNGTKNKVPYLWENWETEAGIGKTKNTIGKEKNILEIAFFKKNKLLLLSIHPVS